MIAYSVISKRILNTAFTVSILFLAAGCYSLKPVADFGKNASAIAGHETVAADFPTILERQRLYGQTGPSVAEGEIAKRRADSKRLVEAQKTLEAYAQALGALAADDLISYDKQIDALNKSIVDGKFAASGDTDAYAKAAKSGFRIFTDWYRRAKIRKIITTYNPAVQSAATQLENIIGEGYLTGLQGEEVMFDQLVAGRSVKSTKDLEGVPQLFAIVIAEHRSTLAAKEADARALHDGIAKFAEAHQKMFDEIQKGGFKEAIEVARKYAGELKDVIKAFNK